ncbi:MAG: class I SAM-dependent methyltransferase [Candidatus Bathyarchaeota archaeon]|nr:MAG: class I SAM-dependent methyltransferase [Candidatus Bathyarchaeota archaeon]
MNYGPASKFYDLFKSDEDVDFYRRLAVRCGGRVLELGVGTARVALELARAGVEVWGVDASQYMLNVANTKLRKENASVRKRIKFQLGDIRDFHFNEEFSLIYIPSSTLEHCVSEEDQSRCLTCVYEALQDGGLLAFDISQRKDASKSTWWIDRRELNQQEEVVRIIFSRMNQQTGVVSVDLFFERYHDGLLSERFHELGEVRIFDRGDVETLLKNRGFKVVEVYGDFNHSPPTGSDSRLIFIAEKKLE